MSRKLPKHIVPIAPQKVPKDRYESTTHLPVLWSFILFDGTIEWHDQSHREESFRKVAKHMKDYEGLTWGEIEQRDHPIAKNQLIRDAQRRLRTIQQDDIDELWRFRFDARRRIWGIRDGRVFKVLWWDPQHKIRPSRLKHT